MARAKAAAVFGRRLQLLELLCVILTAAKEPGAVLDAATIPGGCAPADNIGRGNTFAARLHGDGSSAGYFTALNCGAIAFTCAAIALEGGADSRA